ncbi:MAG TPA: serine/threonine-protein kinase [Microbacterium sp.]|nr:serine/threonine-protein kinase [Microbacterium sp.]
MLPGLTYVRPLGSGGFADVFLYEQEMPRRAVAVKVLPGNLRDPDLVRMFNTEADVLAHLSAHPSIVTVYQAGISADGRPYIVMEYCPGSLAQRYRIERIPVDEVLSIGIRMASALETSHRAGLVHRDIKPSNILVTSFGVAVLADFGIASSLARARHDEMFAMSVPWSAPEVIAEETTGTIASEVWGLGATVYSLLAGHSPFERMDRGQNSRDHLRRRILRASYTRIPRPDVPDAVQRVLAVAMSRLPGDRYPSALAFAEALRSVQAELGLAPTALDVAVEEWIPSPSAVDLADDAVRGPIRTSVSHETSRKSAPTLAVAAGRDGGEDEWFDASAPDRRRGWIIGALALALVASVVTAWALLTSGIF